MTHTSTHSHTPWKCTQRRSGLVTLGLATAACPCHHADALCPCLCPCHAPAHAHAIWSGSCAAGWLGGETGCGAGRGCGDGLCHSCVTVCGGRGRGRGHERKGGRAAGDAHRRLLCPPFCLLRACIGYLPPPPFPSPPLIPSSPSCTSDSEILHRLGGAGAESAAGRACATRW